MSPFLLGFGLFGVLIHGEVISILNNVLVCLFTFTFVLDKVDESIFKSATEYENEQDFTDSQWVFI